MTRPFQFSISLDDRFELALHLAASRKSAARRGVCDIKNAALTLVFCLALAACGGTNASPTVTPAPPNAATGNANGGPAAGAPTAIPVSPVTPAPHGAPPVVPPGLGGKFVFAPGDGSIWLQPAPSAAPVPLVKASPTGFAETPAFSPDGSRVAYMQVGDDAQGNAKGAIQTLGADGQDDRTVATPSEATTEFVWPDYSPDGKWIYYSASIKSAGKYDEQIQRVPSGGGTIEQVLDGGRMPVLSQDGQRLAFVRLDPTTFRQSLWIADADGRNPKRLLSENVFMAIAAPHFSPDGQWILFAESGPPNGPLHGLLLPSQGCSPWLLCALATTAYADGLPWNLWMIGVDGSRSRQLTNIASDSPWPAWSRDGKYVAFFQTNGIFLLDVAQGTITQLTPNGGHGGFDWWSGGG